MGSKTCWRGLRVEFYEWCRVRGASGAMAEDWLQRAMSAEGWLGRCRGITLAEMSVDDLRVYLHSPGPILSPVCTRVALDAFVAFAGDRGLLAHPMLGELPPEACSIDPPPEMIDWEPSWLSCRRPNMRGWIRQAVSLCSSLGLSHRTSSAV